MTDQSEIQRYNGMMINTLIEGLDKQDNLASSQTASRFGALDVQSGADDTGLPMLVVRGPYTVVGSPAGGARKLGMKVGDRSRPQGTVAVTYKSLSSSDWDALGVRILNWRKAITNCRSAISTTAPACNSSIRKANR